MFSELLQTFRLKAEVYNNAQFCGDWAINEHSHDQTCFHMVTIGQCQMSVPGHGQFVLAMGDLVVFPREIPHVMTPMENALERQYPLNKFAPNENKAGTALLCGSLRFEHSGFRHILDALPSVFIIKQAQAPWIEPLLIQIRHEILREQGADDCVLNRLSELLFVYALRHQMQHSSELGFLNLFAASELQPALAMMKDQPEVAWSLEALGRACSMSRTKFSQHFKKVSGVTVNEFFTWWRMQLAFDCLQQRQKIKQVAEKVGYQSESAFSRAFKKCFNLNPSEVS